MLLHINMTQLIVIIYCTFHYVFLIYMHHFKIPLMPSQFISGPNHGNKNDSHALFSMELIINSYCGGVVVVVMFSAFFLSFLFFLDYNASDWQSCVWEGLLGILLTQPGFVLTL